MDKLDKMHEIKKFLITMYSQAIGEGNNLNDNQYIRIIK